MCADLPQSHVVALDVRVVVASASFARVDQFPVVERDATPLVRADRRQPDHRGHTRRHDRGDHHTPLKLQPINHDCPVAAAIATDELYVVGGRLFSRPAASRPIVRAPGRFAPRCVLFSTSLAQAAAFIRRLLHGFCVAAAEPTNCGQRMNQQQQQQQLALHPAASQRLALTEKFQ